MQLQHNSQISWAKQYRNIEAKRLEIKLKLLKTEKMWTESVTDQYPLKQSKELHD